MPSVKVLEEKKKTVEEMTNRLRCKSGVFVDYKGITVTEDTEMRVKLREANVRYNVIKNRLMKFAIKNVGFNELDSILVGTTSLATSDDDPIAPARVIKEYADKLPDYFDIKAGFMDGKILSKDEVLAIASIPPLPMLQAQFLGTLLAPISKLAVVLSAIAEKMADGPIDAKPVEAEEPKAEEVKTEEVKAEEPKTEEVKTEEAKADDSAKKPAEAAEVKDDQKEDDNKKEE